MRYYAYPYTPGCKAAPASRIRGPVVRFVPRLSPRASPSLPAVSPSQAARIYQAAVLEFYGSRPAVVGAEAEALATAMADADPWEWMEAQCWAFRPRQDLRHPRPHQCAGDWARRMWVDYRRACSATVDWQPEDREGWAATAGRSACRATARDPVGLAGDYKAGLVRAELLIAAEILLGCRFSGSRKLDLVREQARRLGVRRADLEAVRIGLAAVERRARRASGEDRLIGGGAET